MSNFSEATSYTTHGCNVEGYYLCERPDECGDVDRYGGVCDKDGCSYNPYKMNATTFYGRGAEFTVDSSRPFTVVTQFLTSDGTDSGDLVEIKRFYVQDGVVIDNAAVGYEEMPGEHNSITDQYADDFTAFLGGMNDFANKGGLKQLGDALGRGTVLSLSLWDDAGSHMKWLDGLYPPDNDPNNPGAVNGPCPADSGVPDDMHVLYPDAFVTFSNIKVGTIGSTFNP